MLAAARARLAARQRPITLARRLNSTNAKESNPDLVQVSLDDKNPDVKNFFKYTWGHWLTNDAKERASRETKFSLKGLVDVLKKDIGAANKAPANAELEVKTITPYHEGKHHKVYRVDLSDMRSFALRIPYALGHEEYREARLKSEVATVDFLRKVHDLNTPEFVSWGATKNNALENQYTISPFVDGELLMKGWNPAVHDIKLKSQTIKPLVDFNEKILATKFNQFGSLYFLDDVDASNKNTLPYDSVPKDLADRWRIGPTTEARFWKGSNSDVGRAFRGPFNTVQEYIEATANVQIAYIHDAIAKGAGAPFPRALQVFEQYGAIVSKLFPEATPENELFGARLHNPDLSPLNVIVGEGETQESWLVDLENTSIRPFALHGPPRFVFHKGPKIFSKEDVPEYDTLPEENKRAIDHFMAQTQNQFAYEYLFRQLSISEDLFNAFLPGLKRRQQLVDTALQCTAENFQDLAYDAVSLSQEWPYLGIESEFPHNFSEAEVDEIAKEIEEYSKKIMNNPFIETKGWLPADTFKQLKDNKVLVETANGDHEFDQKACSW